MISAKKPFAPIFSGFIFIGLLISGCSETTTGGKVTGADPGVLEAPIAFVKRPIPVDEDDEEIQSDLREPLFFAEGGDVYIRSNSTVTATETNITSSVTGGQGDVKDLKPNFDGTKLAFSLRLFDPNPNDDDTPKWNIYEYDLELNSLRCVMDINPSTVECDGFEAAKGDDLAPAYLPDGRIIFSSNRQTTSGQLQTDLNKPRFKALDESEDEWAMYLHIMDEDGTNIRQISFNRSHDLDPTVLTNNLSGQILFSRWDNAATDKGMHLYTMKPDGTQQQILYGRHSHDTGNNNTGTNDARIQFSQPEEMEDGRIMVIARPYTNTYGGGSVLMIDIENFINNDQPVDPLMPASARAQTVATINNVSSADELSLGGRYSAAWPLWDGTNRVLLSKSTCEILADGVNRPCIEPYLSAATVEEVSPDYAIWLYDLNDDAQKPIVQAERGFVFTDVVAIQPRSNQPDYVYDNSSTTYSSAMAGEDIGAIHIKSVYDFGTGTFDGCFLNNDCTDSGASTLVELADPATATADQRPARFVRFVTSVALPDEDDPDLNPQPDLQREAFGPQRNQDMREIIGYAPVEPDGSVKVKVPANTPLAVSVLDSMGRRIGPRHQNWFHVRPGETLECTGCHTGPTQNNPALPHNRHDAEAPSINEGMPATGFPNTLNPADSMPYPVDFGKTMAEVRFDNAASEPEVDVDIEFADYWTDTSGSLVANASFNYRYANLDALLRSPATPACDSWDFRCRIIINYKEHIHPMWALARGVNDADTCTNCHANTDDMDVPMVPAGQLNLTAVTDPEDNDPRIKSYLELFQQDNGQILDMGGQLVTETVQVPVDADGDGQQDVDQNGMLIFDTVPAFTVNPSMSGNSARASYFINKMTNATATRNGSLAPGDVGYVDHSTFMSMDEIKLIIEWLDIGAQYYNNPFDPQCILDNLC